MDSNHPLFKQLGKSDDVEKHERVFINAYHRLTMEGTATPRDFELQGGWIRSVDDPDFYFVYIGNPLNFKNRYYLDTKSGNITKGRFCETQK